MTERPVEKSVHSEASSSPADVARVLNTAVIASKANRPSQMSSRYEKLSSSPAFAAIGEAVRLLSRTEGLTEQEAAKQILDAFRELDSIWDDYVYQEGLSLLRKNLTQNP